MKIFSKQFWILVFVVAAITVVVLQMYEKYFKKPEPGPLIIAPVDE